MEFAGLELPHLTRALSAPLGRKGRRRFLSGAVVPLIAVLILGVLAVPASARAFTPDPALVERATKEGEVNWYTTLIINQIVRPMAQAFEKRFPGIKVQYSRASGSDTALKIINEARARRVSADVFDGSNTVFMLQDAKLVADYRPQSAASWPAELKDPQGHWTALNAYYWTAAVNTNLVKPEDEPKTYEDLLDPKWHGKIAWTYDLTAGGPPGFVHNILTTMGQEKGMAYLRTFASQQPVTIPAAQRVVLDKVISGEYPVCVMILNYHVTISAAKGAPVKWLKMEPLLQTMGLVSVVEAAPHPNAARLFVEFLLSDEGQRVLAENDYLPASPDVPAKAPENKPQQGHFKVNVVTPQMTQDELTKWTAVYHELFR